MTEVIKLSRDYVVGHGEHARPGAQRRFSALSAERGTVSDRVGCRGLRPGTLPHHRTCGFPHTAIGSHGSLPSQSRGLDNLGHSDGLGAFCVRPTVCRSRVATRLLANVLRLRTAALVKMRRARPKAGLRAAEEVADGNLEAGQQPRRRRFPGKAALDELIAPADQRQNLYRLGFGINHRDQRSIPQFMGLIGFRHLSGELVVSVKPLRFWHSRR